MQTLGQHKVWISFTQLQLQTYGVLRQKAFISNQFKKKPQYRMKTGNNTKGTLLRHRHIYATMLKNVANEVCNGMFLNLIAKLKIKYKTK